MTFSVIIPVYNNEKYLDECICSVINQTISRWEMVLVNDGSIDNSYSICQEYQKEYPDRIKVVNQNNQGQLVARTNGIAAATGEYCVFLDADDVLLNTALEYLDEKIKEYEQPDMVLYSLSYMKNQNEIVEAKKLYSEEKYFRGNKLELYKAFFESTLLNSVCTKAVKRTVLKTCFGDAKSYAHLRCSEDRLHSMKILSSVDTVVCTNKVLYIYRQFEGSTTRTFELETLVRFNTKELCLLEEECMMKWGLNVEKWKKKLAANYLNQTMYIFFDYYKMLKKTNKRWKLLKYDWTSFVESDYILEINNNEYVNQVYKKMWNYVIDKRYYQLYLYCENNRWYHKLKDLKRKYISKIC